MRAPFDTTVTVYDGPTTATPGFPRIVGAPARLVSDLFFVDFSAPLNASQAYFTMEVDEPRASVNTDLGAGVYQFDFGKADRVEFASLPGVLWVVVRVELCTWQMPGAPYWRASIVEDEPAPAGCQLTYRERYTSHSMFGVFLADMVRDSPTVWLGDGYSLQAELTATDPDTCMSLWRLTHGSETYEATWNGFGTALFFGVGGTPDFVSVEMV